jgi:hypothetical protein
MVSQPQITSDPAPPKGRRRRRLVGVSLLLLGLGVVAVWWAGRGAIDPRLVGRWENIEPSGLPGDMRFADDGSVSYVAAYISVALQTSARWCVQNDELVFTYPERIDRRISWQALRRNLDNLYFWVVNGGPGTMRMRIVELTQTTLTLELGEAWGPPNDRVARFRRIAE